MKKIFRNILIAGLLLAFPIAASSQTMSEGGWWGYYSDGAPRGDMGTDECETYNAAIFVPGDDPNVVGKTIDKVRLYIRETDYMENLSVWLSTKLPPRIALANVLKQDIDLNTIVGGNSGADAGLPNEITLDKPYTVTSKGVWVGYTFTITHVESEYDWDYASPLATVHGMESLPQASMFMFSMTMPEWFAGSYILPYANFCTQVHLTDAETLGVDDTQNNAFMLEQSEKLRTTNSYDLQGRRVVNPQRGGLYIVGGRKMIVR